MAMHDERPCTCVELLLQPCSVVPSICAMIPALPGMRYGYMRGGVYAPRTAWRIVAVPGHEEA